MEHSAKIIADSVSPDGVRLTTMEVVFPRIVLSEFNTHRVFSRNSASSRAIPVEKMIRMVQEHPYIPTHWGKNQRGMQADEELSADQAERATQEWLDARDEAIRCARHLLERGAHKQITNRLLEPFMWHTVIVTATEWDNFFHLRCDPAAHPEIRLAAERMREAMGGSDPERLDYGEWHLPLVDRETREWVFHESVKAGALDAATALLLEEQGQLGATYDDMLIRISVGRCARVSYLTHDGKRDPLEDIALHDRLLVAGHLSPFEHVARPMARDELPIGYIAGFSDSIPFCGNLRGWVQYRKLIPHEHDIKGER